MAAILTQFDECLKSLASLNKVKNIPKLMPENEFKKFISKQLLSISEDRISTNEKLLDELLKTDLPITLGKLLKSTIACLKLTDLQKDQLNAELENISINNEQKESEQKQKFKLMQKFLKKILDNAAHQKTLEDTLWEEYLASQKGYDPLSPAVKESANSYLQQMQADPNKRAGFVLFTVCFEFIDQMMFQLSGGQIRLSNVEYDSEKHGNGEKSFLQQLWETQTGNKHTPPPSPQ